MIVHFQNVGREKKTWDATVTDLSDRTLLRHIRAQGALRSQNVELVWNDHGTRGTIYVGSFRKVGEYRVEGGFKFTGNEL